MKSNLSSWSGDGQMISNSHTHETSEKVLYPRLTVCIKYSLSGQTISGGSPTQPNSSSLGLHEKQGKRLLALRPDTHTCSHTPDEHVLSRSWVLAPNRHTEIDDGTSKSREQFPQLLATSEGCRARKIAGAAEDHLNTPPPLPDSIILQQFLQILYLLAREKDHTLINVLVSQL